jgi:hypothetical protein
MEMAMTPAGVVWNWSSSLSEAEHGRQRTLRNCGAGLSSPSPSTTRTIISGTTVSSGWILSPAFDLNPDPGGTGLSLNISETDNALNFDLALEVSAFFRLKPVDAEPILQQVKQAVKSWRSHAKKLGIARVDQEIMATAFEA